MAAREKAPLEVFYRVERGEVVSAAFTSRGAPVLLDSSQEWGLIEEAVWDQPTTADIIASGEHALSRKPVPDLLTEAQKWEIDRANGRRLDEDRPPPDRPPPDRRPDP